MTYDADAQAAEEASLHAASAEDLDLMIQQTRQKSADLGEEGVRAHRVSFNPDSWSGLLHQLPDAIVANRSVSRGQVFDIAAEVRDGSRPASDLFTASFLWGTGTTGYGASRYREIVTLAGAERLESAMRNAYDAANQSDGSVDPIAGYAQLYGGYDFRRRAEPSSDAWSRLARFGPAFFTKFLYFSTPGALILDNVLANAVQRRSELNHLVTARGRSVEWTPFRYAVYLHWMQQTAAMLDVSPQLLELTLFSPPRLAADEGPNAE